MKSKWLVFTGVILMLVLLSACGQAGGSDTTASGESVQSSSNAESNAANSNSEVKVVQTEMGEITIPKSPSVWLDYPLSIQNCYMHSVLFLLLFKIIMRSSLNICRNLLKYHEDGHREDTNFEAILEANPDLIIAPAWWSKKDYDQLSAIAPTVLLPEREEWPDELQDIAKVLARKRKPSRYWRI